VSLIRHAETLISLQWYVLVLTLGVVVYTLFRKTRSNLSKNFLHSQKYAIPYTYACRPRIVFAHVSGATYTEKLQVMTIMSLPRLLSYRVAAWLFGRDRLQVVKISFTP